jgi:glycosyltransferase involved in cell wall biosynthesis
MSNPLVSIVIPAYNAANYIGDALQSVFSQDYQPLEVIVVDDGSTDGLEAALEPYRPRIVYHRQANGGLGAARNAGMQLATGEYIAWLDADDLIATNRISVQVAYLTHNPEVVAIGTNFAAFTNGGAVFDRAYAKKYYSEIGRHGLDQLFPAHEDFDPNGASATEAKSQPLSVYFGVVWERLIFGNFIHPPTLMLRRSAREAAGWLRSGLRMAEDWEYITRLARLGPIGFIDAPLLNYRCHPQQMSADESPWICLNQIDVLESTIRDPGSHPPQLSRKLEIQLSEFHQNAARAFAGVDTRKALRHLVQAARLNLRGSRVPFHLARIFAYAVGLKAYPKSSGSSPATTQLP